MQYRTSQYLNLGIGRFHSSIGYYNTAFHQGEWFQTAIGRPFMYEFDDTGGPLPLQEVGITASGLLPSGSWVCTMWSKSEMGERTRLAAIRRKITQTQTTEIRQHCDVCTTRLDTRSADRLLHLPRLSYVL
jgi:hypothetical protein